jgi:hypothetical protein
MNNQSVPWEDPVIKDIIEKFNGHVAELKPVDVVIMKEDADSGSGGDIHG